MRAELMFAVDVPCTVVCTARPTSVDAFGGDPSVPPSRISGLASTRLGGAPVATESFEELT